jgi:hypothetical protein
MIRYDHLRGRRSVTVRDDPWLRARSRLTFGVVVAAKPREGDKVEASPGSTADRCVSGLRRLSTLQAAEIRDPVLTIFLAPKPVGVASDSPDGCSDPNSLRAVGQMTKMAL